MSDKERISDDEVEVTDKVAGAPGIVAVPEDPAAPSKEVSSKRQSLSDIFTIVCLATPRILSGNRLSGKSLSRICPLVLLWLCFD